MNSLNGSLPCMETDSSSVGCNKDAAANILQQGVLLPLLPHSEEERGWASYIRSQRNLNKFIHHFKFDSLVNNPFSRAHEVVHNIWFAGCLHMSIYPAHRKYLHFMVNGLPYQFKVLLFGLSNAPKVFTKWLSVVAVHLKRQGLHLSTYVDDWLIWGHASQ